MSFGQSYKTVHVLGPRAVSRSHWASSDQLIKPNTCTNSPDILLKEAAPHGFTHRINLCLCLICLLEATLWLTPLHCYRAHSASVPSLYSPFSNWHTSTRVPRAIDSWLLVRNNQCSQNECLIRCNKWCPCVGADSFVSTHQSVVEELMPPEMLTGI